MDAKAGPLPQEVGATRPFFLPLIVYLVLFYSVWIVWVYLVYPPMQALGPGGLGYTLIDLATRFLLWVLPVWLYLHFIDHVRPLEYLRLKQYWKRGIVIGLGLSLLNFAGMLWRFGLPHPSMQYVTWNSLLGTSLLIGFFEEIPFRGFLFQKLQEKFPVWLANVLSSLLFLGIHLPGWILLHTLSWLNVVTIFVLGVIFAGVFFYAKTLWSSIITHSLNDFLTAVLFHLS